jgi:hypothetical protein
MMSSVVFLPVYPELPEEALEEAAGRAPAGRA